MAISGAVCFQNTHFPNALHNITCLAIDEIWALYGSDALISAIVPIGPGQSIEANENGVMAGVFQLLGSCVIGPILKQRPLSKRPRTEQQY